MVVIEVLVTTLIFIEMIGEQNLEIMYLSKWEKDFRTRYKGLMSIKYSFMP